MRIGTRDRLWLLAGLVVALLLLGVAWQFFISSQNDTTSSIKQDTITAEDQRTQAQRNLNQLKADAANIDKYKAALAAAQLALPTDPGLPAFLREMHAAGDKAGVTIIKIGVTPPQAVVAATGSANPTATSTGAASGPATPDLYSISISVLASGPIDSLNSFVKQIQQVQPRAALLTSVSTNPAQNAGQFQLNLALLAFVAPSDGASPTVTPTTEVPTAQTTVAG